MDKSIGYEIIRVALGLLLFLKGMVFLVNPDLVYVYLQEDYGFAFFVAFWAHYVVFVQLIGGAFIALGLLTRVATILQVPILIGAIFWVHLFDAAGLVNNPSLEYALFVLFVLVGVFIKGSGRHSIDAWMKNKS